MRLPTKSMHECAICGLVSTDSPCPACGDEETNYGVEALDSQPSPNRESELPFGLDAETELESTDLPFGLEENPESDESGDLVFGIESSPPEQITTLIPFGLEESPISED